MKFHPIKIPDPSDLILEQILSMIRSGDLRASEQLPPEPILQKEFNVTKQQLKSAFKRLELYGVIETRPQSGTYIADIHSQILVGLISNILKIENSSDPLSLIDTRLVLEVRAAELAAELISEHELSELTKINNKFLAEAQKGRRGIELDIFFHMEIIRLSQSSTMLTLYSFITKDLINFWHRFDDLDPLRTQTRLSETMREHEAILAAFKNKSSDKAGLMMRKHLTNVYAEISSILKKDPIKISRSTR